MPSLVLRSEQMCSFAEVIQPCLRDRPTISRRVRSIVLEDGFLVSEPQLRNLKAVLRHFTASVSGLRHVLVRTRPPEACSQLTNESQRIDKETHIKKLKKMFGRVKRSSHVEAIKLKYINAMHDRKIMFDNGWAVHMGKGLDFVRQPPWRDPFNASAECPCHDVGEASINFFYNWSEDVINYVEAIIQRGVVEFDLVV